MNFLPYLISPALTLLIGIAGYALISKSRESAGQAKEASDKEMERIRNRMLDDEERTRKLMQDELERWEGGFMTRLNGTYLRGPEAKLRFEALEKTMERVEHCLVT